MSWGDWGFIDTPEVQHRLAMAWDEWADKIKHRTLNPKNNYYQYEITHPPDKDFGSFLSYNVDHPQKRLDIELLQTHPNFERRGVGEALIRRMHEDYPDYKIVTGPMTDQGEAFHDRLMERVPTAKDWITSRVAMAWDEWADKIRHIPEEEYDLVGQNAYEIHHDPQGRTVSDLSYSVHPDNTVSIHMLHVQPQFQGKGIAEALIRRLHQDYPNHKINPGSMTEQGQGFHDRMLQKEPTARDLVTAYRLASYDETPYWAAAWDDDEDDDDWPEEAREVFRQRSAMAWGDWQDKIQGGCGDGCAYNRTEGRYVIPQAGAFLNYEHAFYNDEPQLWISGIYTHPQNRNDGVAEALVRRLAEDHPGVPINPGIMTGDGQKFHDRMMQKEPTAKDVVTAANRLIQAMAWQDYVDQIRSRPEQEDDQGMTFGGRYVVPGTGSVLSYYYTNHEGDPEVLLNRQDYAPEKHKIKIDNTLTSKDSRGNGAMESLFRRLVDDHPGFSIDPGHMTEDGRAFYDRMLEKEPTARNLIV